jgi:hypothetical protein
MLSCESRYHLVSVLLLLGVADAEVTELLQVLECSPDVETSV